MSNNSDYNHSTDFYKFLLAFKPVQHTAPVLQTDHLGLTGTIIPNEPDYDLGSELFPLLSKSLK